MRLKIRKTASGTYYIPSISIKQLRDMSTNQKRRWTLSKDQRNLYLEAE
jgi:hypothetical protein